MHPETGYKLRKLCKNRARNTPVWGVYIPHFDQISAKISVLGSYHLIVAPMGVKFGMEEGTEDPLLHAKFHPHWCNGEGVNVEYKRPAGAYPLRHFHKIYRVCTPFHDALGVNISLDLLKGLWSYGGFKLRESGYPQIFSSL